MSNDTTGANNTYVIITEVTCDLPRKYTEKHNIIMTPLTYTIDEKDYNGSREANLPEKDFYDLLRAGKMAKTAQVTPQIAEDFFVTQLDKGLDILYIGFSSGLSGSFQSSWAAANELRTRYPERKIMVIDSLCASLGQGLLVDFAVRLKEAGMEIEKCCDMTLDRVQHVCHYFTVDDLNHLYRGGRVSKVTALVGGLLGIKPLMHVNEQGKLVPYGKIRGRKASLDALVARMAQKVGCEKNPYVMISHGDCLEDAQYVATQIAEKYGLDTSVINFVGPVIGSHSGPGTIALFYMGSDRGEKAL